MIYLDKLHDLFYNQFSSVEEYLYNELVKNSPFTCGLPFTVQPEIKSACLSTLLLKYRNEFYKIKKEELFDIC